MSRPSRTSIRGGRAPRAARAPARTASQIASPVAALRDALGNRAFGSFLQTKLAVGRTDDPREREADAVADQVVRPPAAGGAAMQQGAPAPAAPLDDTTASRVQSMRRQGEPLAPAIRSHFEPRLGRDLSSVRTHTGPAADETSRAVGARAYTVGSDIAFRQGAFVPHTGEGQRLLAHELTHVVQQANAPGAPATLARQTDDGWLARASRTFDEVTGKIPPDYKDRLAAAGQSAKEQGPTLAKEYIRDKTLETIGAVKGAGLQVAEAVDTVVWVGTQYQELKDAAVDTVVKAGKQRGLGPTGERAIRQAVKTGSAALLAVPGIGTIEGLARAGEGLKDVGLVDPATGQPGIASTVGTGYDLIGQVAEDLIGAPAQPEGQLFTPLERGELAGAVGTQVALSFVGAEEVKVGLAALGALSGIRGLVETVKHDRGNFYKDPAFWSSLITIVLSVIGLRQTKAAGKITQFLIKSGAILQAVPAVWQMIDHLLDPKLAADPDQQHKVLLQDTTAIVQVVKDIVLQLIHASTVKGPSHGFEETGAGTKPVVKAATGGANEPPQKALPPAAAGGGRPQQEPLVWVNTRRGKSRGVYHPEGSKWFGKTKEGFAIPQSWADDMGFRRAGTPRSRPAAPIEPRIVSGRQAESLGAGAERGPKFISATAQAESAVTTTSIPPDIQEAHAYNRLLDNGELGLQRPLGANVRGVDAITVQVEYDANGRPARAKIFLNDMTRPGVEKGSKPSHANWQAELNDALSQQRLNLGDPDLHRVIRQASADGEVYVRTVRVDLSRGIAGSVTLDAPTRLGGGGGSSSPPTFPILSPPTGTGSQDQTVDDEQETE